MTGARPPIALLRALANGPGGFRGDATQNPDAALIARCRQVAEAELDWYYSYLVAPVDEADDIPLPNTKESRATIIATAATTIEGMKAKALAYVSWCDESFNHDQPEFLRSLLLDFAGAERAAIMARLAGRYGPLPPNYTPDGQWMGPLGEFTSVGEARS